MNKTNKLVNLEVYKLNDNKYFMSYTANWCGPCKRIKPTVLKLVDKYEKIYSKELSQHEFQENINIYIPFFIISQNFKDSNNFLTTDKIQTSNEEEIKKFFNIHNLMNIDENF